MAELLDQTNHGVLAGRYTLRKELQHDLNSETWFSADEDDEPCLVKLWPFETEKPDDPARAYWNSELRVIWRICSSRRAGESILRIRDAGVDSLRRAFVMVLKSGGAGYVPLSRALNGSPRSEALSFKELRRGSYRAEVWNAIARIAEGLNLLHSQHVIHRNVSADSVFINPATTLDSWRLGGFEWSLRVGTTGSKTLNVGPWVMPPAGRDGLRVYSFESDWYAFGLLIARLFCSLESFSDLDADALAEGARRDVQQSGKSRLELIEQSFIADLIREDPQHRLIHGQDIVARCQHIARILASGNPEDQSGRPLVLAFSLDNTKLVQAAREVGFVPDPAEPDAPFSRLSPDHVEAFKRFLREDVRGGALYSIPRKENCILLGRRLSLVISRFADPGVLDQQGTWDAAYVVKASELFSGRIDLCRKLGNAQIVALPIREAVAQSDRQSWERLILKSRGPDTELGSDQQRLLDFLRATNQLELLMSVGKIFAYKLEGAPEITNEGYEVIYISEDLSAQRLPDYARVKGGLVALLLEDLRAKKPFNGEVMLKPDDRLRTEEVDEKDWWRVDGTPIPNTPIRLTRQRHPAATAAPAAGFVRTRGLWGQLRLIERRQDAINRLEQHSFLLSALAAPGEVCMDTNSVTDAYVLRPEDVDASKRAVIEDVERVRPMYVLQGPPGTGKTHQVAYLLRRVFADDPMAQVLVTAQAKGAVNVLLDRVEKVFADVGADHAPLSVRLGSKVDRQAAADFHSVENVTHRLLHGTLQNLPVPDQRSDRQARWSEIVSDALSMSPTSTGARFRADFQQLVKRSAAIVYCTTSSGDLAELAEGSEEFDWTFDWSIVEEAGKAHGFDLALPLQAGHRWLLLGDQRQLEPFQLESFERAVADFDGAVAALETINDSGYVDAQWLRGWRDLTAEEKDGFKRFCREWLKTFAMLYTNLERVLGAKFVTSTEARGAFVGMLTYQWRMHPTIGSLVSEVFYENEVKNSAGTVDEQGVARGEFQHQLTLPAVGPTYDVTGHAIAWIDIPWSQQAPQWREVGERENMLNYSNTGEASVVRRVVEQLRPTSPDVNMSIAILSPYTQQVYRLRSELQGVQRARHFRLVASLGARDPMTESRWAHTVDSFQGNQAEVVIVSLVRNNGRPAGTGLGFLSAATRMNVLLSRAEKLLVLVGSWEFFQHQVHHIADDDPNLGFWRRILDRLAASFANGSAVRIPATALSPNNR